MHKYSGKVQRLRVLRSFLMSGIKRVKLDLFRHTCCEKKKTTLHYTHQGTHVLEQYKQIKQRL